MTIRILESCVVQYRSQLIRPFSTSRGTTRGNSNALILLTAEFNGRQIQGLGEAVPRTRLTGDPVDAVWPFLLQAVDKLRGVELNSSTLDACLSSIRSKLKEVEIIARELVPSRDKATPLRGSFTGVEVALLDLCGKAFDISIAEVLGGTLAPIRVTADTISAGQSFETRAKHLADRSKRYVAWRIKGDENEKVNIDYLRGLTKMNSDKGINNMLWIDFNQALKLDTAIAFIDRLVKEHADGLIAGRIMMEQPTPAADFEALSHLQAYADSHRTENLEITIMADESLHTLEDWYKLAESGGCGAINIKVPKAGGLIKSIEIAQDAIKKHPKIEIYIGGMLATTDITAWTIYQLACAMPGFRYTTTNPTGNLKVNFAENRYQFRSKSISYVDPPSTPGLGTGVLFPFLAPIVERYHPETAQNYLRTATTIKNDAHKHSYNWPEANHFAQLEFDSFLLQTSAISHGMTTQRLTPVLFTSAPLETPKDIVGFWWSAGNYASRYGIMICGQKQLTRIMLRSSGVPVPAGRKFLNAARKSAVDYAKRIGWPVVVKPAAGGGGRAVTTNICSEADIRSAIEAVKEGESFIVEKHVEGADYRILATEDKIISVFTRRAARVVGDGVSSIARLVDQANTLREANPRYRNSLIKLAEKTTQHMLKQQGLTPDSIPEKGTTVLLSPAANISQGGEGVDVTAETHPSILEFAREIRRGLPGLGHCGIDLLMEDHTKPVSEQSVGVCEVNSYSEIGMHCFPSEGDFANAAEELYRYNAKRAGVELGSRRELVSIELAAEGISKPEAFTAWLTERAAEFCVHLEDVTHDDERVTCIATGWVTPVAALAALAISPGASMLVEAVTTRPVETRVLPVMSLPQVQKESRRALVSGQVQGVGYRLWLQAEARARGIAGFARNRSDGTVEAVLEGPPDAVEDLIAAMHKGPDKASVASVEVRGWTRPLRNGSDFLRYKTVEL